MGDRLEVKIDGNASGFKHAMDTVRTQAKGAASEIAHSWTGGIVGGILGAFSFETVKSAIESFVSTAKGIKDTAEQLEISTDATQKWAKAADEAEQSLQGVYNVISAIQSKRQEALRDPKAADLFSGMGISRYDVLNEENSEFAKHVLLAGGASAEHKKLLEQIVGRRGLKLIPAAPHYDAAKPDYGPDALKAAEEIDKSEKRASSAVGRFFGGIIAWIYKSIETSERKERESEARIIAGEEKGGPVWNWLHRHNSDEALQANFEEVFKQKFGSPPAPSKPPKPTLKPGEDPLEGIKSQQEMEYQLRQEEAEMSLHAAERHNMTIAGRKASIKTDLGSLTKEIEARTQAADLRLIYGMTQKQQGWLQSTDVEKQLQADYLTLLGLRGKAAGLTGELRQGTNFNMSADSLARVGLFSSSTLSVNPMIQLSQKQVSILEKIEHNTSQHPVNPHRR